MALSSQQLVRATREERGYTVCMLGGGGLGDVKALSSHSSPFLLPESAVVLNLLLSLPEELSHLPCTALLEHMTKTYAQLMAPQTSLPGEKRPRPGTEDGGTGSTGPEEPDQASPQTSEPIEPRLAWKAVGICPLNPFLVPLDLLSQVPTPSR